MHSSYSLVAVHINIYYTVYYIYNVYVFSALCTIVLGWPFRSKLPTVLITVLHNVGNKWLEVIEVSNLDGEANKSWC